MCFVLIYLVSKGSTVQLNFLKSNMCITLVLEITYHSYLVKDMLKLEHFRYCTFIEEIF